MPHASEEALHAEVGWIEELFGPWTKQLSQNSCVSVHVQDGAAYNANAMRCSGAGQGAFKVSTQSI